MYIQDSLHTIYARLTAYGRKQMSRGKLDFSYFSVGDSEIDYRLSEAVAILRPEDTPPNIKTRILDDEADQIPRKPLQAIKDAKFVAKNDAKERGFFLYSDAWSIRDEFYYSKQEGIIELCSTGATTGSTFSNVLVLDKAINVEAGDLLMLSMNADPASAGSPITGTTDVSYRPYLFYKIEGITGTTVQLDRQVPISRLCDSPYFIYPSDFSYYDKSPNAYWDKASNNYEDTCPEAEDVEVWNLNIAHPESALGLSGSTWEQYGGYGSRNWLNAINYFDLDPNSRVGIVHYTNNTINNFYGEGFYRDTAYIELPTIIHPLNDSIGVRLYCEGDSKSIAKGDFLLEYYDLAVQVSGSTGHIVGKCLPEQKIFLIEDQELLAAMSYKSDRNMAYPDFNASLIYNESLSPILTDTENMDLWVTYGFLSNTFVSPIPYQKPKRLSVSAQEGCAPLPKASLQISFDSSLFKHIGLLPEKPFEFNTLYALLQKVPTGSRPSPDAWRYVSIYESTSGITQSSLAISIIEGTDYETAPIFDLGQYISLPMASEPNRLQFGDEFFLYGNVGCDIKSDVFQSSFYIPMDFDSFAYSENPTWSDDLGYVDVSEIAIYDSNAKPVVWAKLPVPVRKPCGQNRTLIVNLDF